MPDLRDIAIKSLNVIRYAEYHGTTQSRPTFSESAFRRMTGTANAIARDLGLIKKPRPDQCENFDNMFDVLATSVETWCSKGEQDAQRAQVFRIAYQDARAAWNLLVRGPQRVA